MKCIFCDAKADSKEHAIPAWVANRLKLRGRFLNLYGAVGDREPRKQPISIASHRRRIFCTPCQKHFKLLEDAVIPFLLPMFQGKPVTLSADRQKLLAVWGAKTAYALIAAEHGLEDVTPQDHRYWLRELDEPATEVYVGYAPWDGNNWLHVGEALTQSSPIYTSERTYGAVLAIEKLALKVFGITDTRLPGPIFFADRPSIKQVWPTLDRPIHWPPPHPFGDANIVQLITWLPI